MKKMLVNLGGVVSIFLMLTPLVIIYNYEKIDEKEFWLYFVCSILYDIYQYSIIVKEQALEKEQEHYYKFVKDADKKLNIKTDYKTKFENLEKYIEDYFKRFLN